MEEETRQLWSAHDDLEQYPMKTSLENVGVSEGCFTSTEGVVLGLGLGLGLGLPLRLTPSVSSVFFLLLILLLLY